MPGPPVQTRSRLLLVHATHQINGSQNEQTARGNGQCALFKPDFRCVPMVNVIRPHAFVSLGIALLCIACAGNAQKPEPLVPAELVDTFNGELHLLRDTCITTASYHPYYVGQPKASITLKRPYAEEDYHDLDKSELPELARRWDRAAWQPGAMEVLVDTATVIATKKPLDLWHLAKEAQQGAQPPTHHPGYAVYIRNNSDERVGLQYGTYLPLILEAQDSLKEWRALEAPFIYYCGTGLRYPSLAPGHIAITACPIPSGSFKTQLRLKFGWKSDFTTSNEFTGSIDYRQFSTSLESN